MAWTSPRTWVAGEKPTASTLNTHIRDNLKAIGDARTSYTPTLGNWTLNNGTITGAYSSAGKDTKVRITFVFGSTTVVSGSPTFTLPVNAISARSVSGTVLFFDTSGTAYYGGWVFSQSVSSLIVRTDASAVLSSTAPFTWATGDEIVINATYEAA